MFIKTTRAGGYEYIKLVESYRKEGGSTGHRVLYNFGRADNLRNEQSFLRMVKRLCEVGNIPLPNDDGRIADEEPLSDCSEAVFYNYGYLAYRRLWNDLYIQGCLEEVQHCSKISYSLPDVVFLMALQHLLEPRSKLSTHAHQERYLNIDKVSLQHMYRALDKLADSKGEIESSLFDYNYTRAGRKVDVVFYDVTTVSFESVVADELRNFGFSKECKFNEVQVVMGMIIDSSGFPVGYELFPGNTFDGKTMVKALENIKKRFGINRVIIVGDRGINSKGNLALIKEAGYGYIVASKIRQMGEAMQKKILRQDDFLPLGGTAAEAGFRYKTMEYDNIFTDEDGKKHVLQENLLITYSPKRANKDASDRARLIAKAEKLLQDPQKITAANKRGGKKYIDRKDPKKSETWTLATAKIEKDAQFDGYYGLQTSERELSAEETIEAHSLLWKIEESFRIMKTTLEVQPVFHWNERRIRGHFVVCFLAFMMERCMESLLAGCFKPGGDTRDKPSPDKIREALSSMQVAAVTTGGQDLFIKAKPLPLAKTIFKMLKLPIPDNISSKEDLNALLFIESRRECAQMSLF